MIEVPQFFFHDDLRMDLGSRKLLGIFHRSQTPNVIWYNVRDVTA